MLIRDKIENKFVLNGKIKCRKPKILLNGKIKWKDKNGYIFLLNGKIEEGVYFC